MCLYTFLSQTSTFGIRLSGSILFMVIALYSSGFAAKLATFSPVVFQSFHINVKISSIVHGYCDA